MEMIGSEAAAKAAVTTGIVALDHVMGGLRVGLTVVTGREGTGKQALAEQIVVRLVVAGLRVAVFSLYTVGDVLRDQLVHRAQVQGLQNEGYGERLYVDGNPALTAFEISDVLEMVRPDAVYVAQLGLLRSAHARYRADELRDVAACLRCLAQDFGVPVIAVASMIAPDDMVADENGVPRYLVDSATCVMLVSKPVYSRQAISVVKNENGRTGTIDLLFDDQAETYR